MKVMRQRRVWIWHRMVSWGKNAVTNIEFYNSREIFDEVQKIKWWRQRFCDRLTCNADRSKYWYFLFNQGVTKYRNCLSVYIEMADIRTLHVTRNGQQMSVMQWDGTTQWFFLSVWRCSLLWQHWQEIMELLVAVDFFESLTDMKPEY